MDREQKERELREKEASRVVTGLGVDETSLKPTYTRHHTTSQHTFNMYFVYTVESYKSPDLLFATLRHCWL